jgi:hypothetical protein
MTNDNIGTGPRVVPANTQGGGSLVSPGNGYPPASYGEAKIDHSEQMGISILARCMDCGLSVPPDTLGAHVADHGGQYATDFGKDFQI